MPAPTTDAAAPVRRHRHRLKAPVVIATAVAMLLVPQAGAALGSTSGGTSTSTSTSTSSSSRSLSLGSSGAAVKRLQRKLGVRATGYYGNETRRAVKRFQARRGLTADGVAGPATLRALGVSARGASYSTGGASPSGGSSSGGGSSTDLPPVLKRIAQCESGGNPRAISSSGRYRGKYQFDQGTWEAIGGTGDPAAAPESTQDRLALRLYRKRGTAPWPNCA
jgi:peptidoglycan hydrolase-like protein with peptidoglycan-binding domain